MYDYFGEGDYDVTENNIRYLLGIDKVTTAIKNKNETQAYSQTSETYLGYARADSDLSPSLISDKTTLYHFPSSLDTNHWALEGAWYIAPDKIISTKANAALKLHLNARKVFIVMGNKQGQPINVNILLNNVKQHSILVDKHSIYEVVTLNKFADKTLTVIATTPGLEVYTLTFGS